jgi:two-component system, sporulation sensor kinase A
MSISFKEGNRMQDRLTMFTHNNKQSFLLTANPPYLLRLTNDGYITYASIYIHELLGYHQNEVVQTSFKDYCYFRDYDHFIQKLESVIATNEDYFELEMRIRNKTGKFQYMQVAATVLRSSFHRKIEGILLIMRETTVQESELEVLYNEKLGQYEALVNHLLEAVVIVCGEKIVFANQASTCLFKANHVKEIIGKSIYDFLHSAHYEIWKSEYMKSAQTVGPMEFVWKTVCGNTFQSEVMIIPTNYKGEQAFQLLIRDVTERKKTERTLIEAEKLSMAGQLAAGIAHEIRNPLTALKGFLQLMKLDLKTKSDYWDIMESELERIETISNELLFLAKPRSTELKPISLKKLIQEVSLLLETQAIMHNIIINKHFPNEEIVIYGNEVQIKQVFVNLIKNAIEVMPNGGHIFINMEKDGGFVNISVIDQGCGIPEEHLEKIGQPFFSTKKEGTGLGLMITYNIVQNHHGTISVSSQVNVGTTFTITLPLFDETQYIAK